MKAIWENHVVAESDKVIEYRGNVYFPESSIKKHYFKPSESRSETFCKGSALYYDLVAHNKHVKGAAWYYPTPKKGSTQLKGFIGFWRGIELKE